MIVVPLGLVLLVVVVVAFVWWCLRSDDPMVQALAQCFVVLTGVAGILILFLLLVSSLPSINISFGG